MGSGNYEERWHAANVLDSPSQRPITLGMALINFRVARLMLNS